MTKSLTFLLGGARSGKSHYAEEWAKAHGQSVLFVATAQAFDTEMAERIDAHRASRPASWATLEAPLNTGTSIQQRWHESAFDTVVIDCMTLLASNALLTLPDNCTQEDATVAVVNEANQLMTAYNQTDANWLIVSNEVGMGIVPHTKLGRFYRDALGRANQQIAMHAHTVLLFVAGLPWLLKPTTP